MFENVKTLTNKELSNKLRGGYFTQYGYLADIAEALARILLTIPETKRR